MIYFLLRKESIDLCQDVGCKMVSVACARISLRLIIISAQVSYLFVLQGKEGLDTSFLSPHQFEGAPLCVENHVPSCKCLFWILCYMRGFGHKTFCCHCQENNLVKYTLIFFSRIPHVHNTHQITVDQLRVGFEGIGDCFRGFYIFINFNFV